MTLTTYGVLREKLIANGYVPTSALRPGSYGWQFSDDPAAVVCIPQHGSNCEVPDAHKHTIASLNVLARDPKVRAAIVAVLAKHGIKGGPVRTDSAGNDAYLVRLDDEYSPPQSEEIERAFAVGGFIRNPRSGNESAIIRCDVEWRNGDLLTTPRAQLPGIADADTLRAIVSAVREVVMKYRPAEVEAHDNDWSKAREPSWKPYEPVQPERSSGLTAAERAVLQSGGKRALGHRETARLAALAADGAD
jgi:hypothetical protein